MGFTSLRSHSALVLANVRARLEPLWVVACRSSLEPSGVGCAERGRPTTPDRRRTPLIVDAGDANTRRDIVAMESRTGCEREAPATSVALDSNRAVPSEGTTRNFSTSHAPTSRSEAGRAGRVAGSLEATLSAAQPNIHRRSSDHLGAVHVIKCLTGVVRTFGYNACCRQRLGYVWPRSPTSGRKSQRCRCRNFKNPDVLI